MIIFDLGTLGWRESALEYVGGNVVKLWIRVLIYGLLYMFLISAIFALGEEIGWRGFLLRKLPKNFSFLSRALVVGVIWGSWHIPLYLELETPTIKILIFLLNVLLFSIIYTRLFEKEHSIWPSTFAHAAHNTLFNSFLPQILLSTRGSEILHGEEGLLVTIAWSIYC